MGGHGHGKDPYKIPHYSIYRVEGIPELEAIQKALAAQGLSDPWLRNEAWRYDKKEWGTVSSRTRTFFFRGLKLGFAAFALTIAGTAAYDHLYPSTEHHDDDH